MEAATAATARFPSIISLPMADTSRRASVATISSCDISSSCMSASLAAEFAAEGRAEGEEY
eukprot:CAMPEP_0179465374 /NCGR_PEP_ID=MMETSP0799-20121207/46943_1 /TAXON_ID=46947 /ORGANISM="Geminigera cryophila, Strain CCMP2564" /LENGTH=60 /DNA_ID=CAMNT_0021269599 /DNA_START=71 /DNA_END=250 /DNA_ORIENTATION=-